LARQIGATRRANGPLVYAIRASGGRAATLHLFVDENARSRQSSDPAETPAGKRGARRKKGSDGIMSNGPLLSLKELDERIAITRDNIRQLIEQAAAYSGAKDEERSTDRIAQQNEELERLLKQRETLLKK